MSWDACKKLAEKALCVVVVVSILIIMVAMLVVGVCDNPHNAFSVMVMTLVYMVAFVTGVYVGRQARAGAIWLSCKIANKLKG